MMIVIGGMTRHLLQDTKFSRFKQFHFLSPWSEARFAKANARRAIGSSFGGERVEI